MALWLSGLPTLAEEEWKYRFFTRVLNAQTGKPLEESITAEIKIVSKIDDHTFKAVIRDNTKAFRMDAKLFSLADQEYLRKWNPTFAIDLRDLPRLEHGQETQVARETLAHDGGGDRGNRRPCDGGNLSELQDR